MANYKLYEDINPEIRAVAEIFDKYCAKNHIEYTVESDEHNEQGFHVNIEDIGPIKSHMDEACADHKVTMKVEPDKFGNLFIFRLEPLQEIEETSGSNLPEDQYKYASRKLIRTQSAFRSSFGKSKSFGGHGAAKNESFENALKKKLNEGVLGIQSQEVLFVIGPQKSQDQSDIVIKNLLQKATEMLNILENDSNEWPEITNLVKTIINKLEAESTHSMHDIDKIIDSELP